MSGSATIISSYLLTDRKDPDQSSCSNIGSHNPSIVYLIYNPPWLTHSKGHGASHSHTSTICSHTGANQRSCFQSITLKRKIPRSWDRGSGIFAFVPSSSSTHLHPLHPSWGPHARFASSYFCLFLIILDPFWIVTQIQSHKRLSQSHLRQTQTCLFSTDVIHNAVIVTR